VAATCGSYSPVFRTWMRVYTRSRKSHRGVESANTDGWHTGASSTAVGPMKATISMLPAESAQTHQSLAEQITAAHSRFRPKSQLMPIPRTVAVSDTRSQIPPHLESSSLLKRNAMPWRAHGPPWALGLIGASLIDGTHLHSASFAPWIALSYTSVRLLLIITTNLSCPSPNVYTLPLADSGLLQRRV
jgi:hypothetical protein